MLQIIRLSSSSRTFRSTVAKEDENHSHSTVHIRLQIFYRNCFGERRTWGIETTRNAKSMQKADLSTGRRCIDAEERAMACKLLWQWRLKHPRGLGDFRNELQWRWIWGSIDDGNCCAETNVNGSWREAAGSTAKRFCNRTSCHRQIERTKWIYI
jgi:hypothetical protein